MAARRSRSRRKQRSTLGAAQAAIGDYLGRGTKHANEAITTFLSSFETSHLIDALKKQAQSASRRVGLSSAPRKRKRRAAGKRGTATVRRQAAAKMRSMQKRGKRRAKRR